MPKLYTPSKRETTPKEFIKQLKDLELKAVSGVESSFGKKNIGPTIKDPESLQYGAAAGGPFGTMPRTAIEAWQREKELQEKYPEFQNFVGNHSLQEESAPESNAQITRLLADNPQLAYDVARKDLDYRKSRIPEDPQRAIASLHEGITGAKRMSDEDLKQQDYLQKYNMYDRMVRDQAKKDLSTLRSEPEDQSIDTDNMRLLKKILATPE